MRPAFIAVAACLARRASLALAAIVAIAPISSSAVTPIMSLEQQLAGYKSSKRVLLVFAPAADDARFQAQRARWNSEKGAFVDYELVVLPAFTTEEAAPLAKRYGIKPGAFAVLLIGKDGNEAYRSEVLVEAKDLYRRIDAMPMRRAEVRERSRD